MKVRSAVLLAAMSLLWQRRKARRAMTGAHAREPAIGRLVARMGSVSQLGATRFTRQGPFWALAQS